MKKHIYILGLLLGLVGLSACNGDYDDWTSPQANPQENAIEVKGFTAAKTFDALDLNSNTDSIQMFKLEGVSLPEGYTVENTRVVLTPKGDGLKSALPKTLYTSNSLKVDSASLQSFLIEAYGKSPKPVPHEVEGHVYADVNANGEEVLIDAGTIKYQFTPAKVIIPIYYIFGDFSAWSADGAKKGLVIPTSETTAEYVTYFDAGKYMKMWIGSNIGDWANVTGTEADGYNKESGAFVSGDVKAFRSSGTGYYAFRMDLSSNTFKWVKLDNQNPTEYEHIGMVGDGVGSWDKDLDLEQNTPHCWYALGVTLKEGPVKFRANHGWTVNWGAKAEDLKHLDENMYGTGVQDADNISVAAGKYNVYFNDITGNFCFVPVE